MSVRPQSKDKPAAASFQWDDPFLSTTSSPKTSA